LGELKAFLERPRYFSGRLLTVADFSAEQHYVISRQRLHNRNVHGHGVVCGLQVFTSSGSSSSAVLRVAPGHAIDCQGNDIAVLTEAVADPLPERGEVIYLCLEWAERETEFSPTVDTQEPGRQEATRVEEYAVLKYETTPPCAPHKEKCKKRESCGDQHGVTLARLTKNRGVWKLDQRFKPCRARV
jgi:hypothetical protein